MSVIACEIMIDPTQPNRFEKKKNTYPPAASFDREPALLLRFLLYTGVRLGEALALRWEDVRLAESVAWVRRQKCAGICAPSSIVLQDENRWRGRGGPPRRPNH